MADQRPATDLLLGQLAECVKDVRAHQHPERGEDLYCLNLHAFMGERMAAVLKRLADEQAEVRKLQGRIVALADEATGMAVVVGAAIRYYRSGGDVDDHNDLMDAVAALEAAGFTVVDGGDA